MSESIAAAVIAAIVPNHASTSRYLGEAIDSLIMQEPHLIRQIVVINDTHGSGPAWARNVAAQRVLPSVNWLLLLDADDLIAPGFLAAAEPWLDLTNAQVIVPSSLPLNKAIERDNYLPYCCLVRVGYWNYLGGHQEPSSRGRGLCDWDFWIRVWRDEGGANVSMIDPTLFVHRERADSMSHSWEPGQFEAMRADLWKMYGVAECE